MENLNIKLFFRFVRKKSNCVIFAVLQYRVADDITSFILLFYTDVKAMFKTKAKAAGGATLVQNGKRKKIEEPEIEIKVRKFLCQFGK